MGQGRRLLSRARQLGAAPLTSASSPRRHALPTAAPCRPRTAPRPLPPPSTPCFIRCITRCSRRAWTLAAFGPPDMLARTRPSAALLLGVALAICSGARRPGCSRLGCSRPPPLACARLAPAAARCLWPCPTAALPLPARQQPMAALSLNPSDATRSPLPPPRAPLPPSAHAAHGAAAARGLAAAKCVEGEGGCLTCTGSKCTECEHYHALDPTTGTWCGGAASLAGRAPAAAAAAQRCAS